jgi:origin recognition complex subunit 5
MFSCSPNPAMAKSGRTAEDRKEGKLQHERYLCSYLSKPHATSNCSQIQRKLLGPQAFPIERLLAIFPVIMPESIPSSVDIQAQIATLTSLRLLMKVTSLDPLDGSSKWKVNVGWEYIRRIARTIKFDIEDYLVE